MENTKQINLWGNQIDEPPVNRPVNRPVSLISFYKMRAYDHYSQKDSIWFSLRIFYTGEKQEKLITSKILFDYHYLRHKLCLNSVKSNIQRLLNEHAIKFIYRGGPNKRTNYYQITDKGKLIFEKYLNENGFTNEIN